MTTNSMQIVILSLQLCSFQGGQAHLTMISRQASELGKPILNPGQHSLPILIAGNEGPLTGTHIPAHHRLLGPTSPQQTSKAVLQTLLSRVFQLNLSSDLHSLAVKRGHSEDSYI